MDDIIFTNLKDLYERLLPALKSKKEEIRKMGFDITEEEIWNYLKDKRWKNAYDLLLYQMVDDIINVEAILLIDFYKKESA